MKIFIGKLSYSVNFSLFSKIDSISHRLPFSRIWVIPMFCLSEYKSERESVCVCVCVRLCHQSKWKSRYLLLCLSGFLDEVSAKQGCHLDFLKSE
jgi:hypothetical protein